MSNEHDHSASIGGAQSGSPTVEQVIDALRPVQDPELNRSIVELNMVRDVMIDAGRVDVLIALTVAGCPLRAEITSRVTSALAPLDGVADVQVSMTVMTPEELDEVRAKMQGGSSSNHGSAHNPHNPHDGHGHGPAARVVPFNTPESKTRVLAISSGKGGVGKSSVTVNLAVSLARQGYDVGILDADVYGFSIPKMLGIVDEPQVHDQMILPPEAHGVRCISIDYFLDEDQPVMWRGPMLHKALEQFLVDVIWGEPDFLLIDMPPGTGDVAMSMAKYLPSAATYVVTTPQPAAQRVAQRSGAMAREMKQPLAGVIENMSWFTGDDNKRYELFGSGGGQVLADNLGIPLLAQIPLEPLLREGGDIGAPVVASNPESEAAFAFDELARTIDKLGPRRIYRRELAVR